MTRKEANEALDRLFDYCEEIDNHIPEEERTGYDMLPDIQALRKFVSAENKGFDGMTNGDVIQALFPNISKYNNALLENHSRNILFDDEWWNALYKKGGE